MALTDKQADYVETMGATSFLMQRVRTLYRLYEALLGTTIQDIFVSEYVSKEAGRVYEALWVFTPELVGEAQIPQDGSDHLDIVPLRNSIYHWIIDAQSYDLRRATERSSLALEIWFAAQRVGTLRASGVNCDHLWKMAKVYFGPNFAVPNRVV
jgi:hypothetical protein